jgi:hypothetical protein
VTSATALGVGQFVASAADRGLPMYLARASAEFLFALAASGAHHGVTVVSARFPFRCDLCQGQVELDVDASTRTELAEGRAGPSCQRCGGTTRVAVPAGVLGIALSLPFAEAPLPMGRYLTDARGTGTFTPLPGSRPPEPFERFLLLRRIGVGGMAEVHLACEQDGEELLAIKRIHAHLSANPKFVEMLQQEATVGMRLDHPNVVRVFEGGVAHGQHYLVMEYVRGWDLSTILRLAADLARPMPIVAVCRLIADVAHGLGAAHDYLNEEGTPLPIVHRDVSPANVLISDQAQVKLIDFGIAKAADTVIHTDSGVVKGKVAYLAPERFQEAHAIDVRQDVFSAGVILHECLVGKSLFHRDSQVATMRAVIEEPIPSVRHLRPDVPADLEAIVLTALARRPEERYPSGSDLARDLEIELLRVADTLTPPDLERWLESLIAEGLERGLLSPGRDGLAPRYRVVKRADTDPG